MIRLIILSIFSFPSLASSEIKAASAKTERKSYNSVSNISLSIFIFIMPLPSLHRFIISNNEILGCLASPGILSDTKLVFTKEYSIMVPATILVECNGTSFRKICSTHKDFSGNTFVRFKKIEIDYTVQYLIPHFRSNDFICMSCNKIHNGKSSKCCSLENSPIRINKAELYKIEIPHVSQVNSTIIKARSNFVDLHFPDILSTIILR